MRPTYPIHFRQLHAGESQGFEDELDPDFLEIDEPELRFDGPVHIKGVASVAGEHLVILFELIEAKAWMPCLVCNEEAEVLLRLEHLSVGEELDKHPSGIFDCGPLLRELLLVELPQVAECQQGGCPRRQELRQYFKN